MDKTVINFRPCLDKRIDIVSILNVSGPSDLTAEFGANVSNEYLGAYPCYTVCGDAIAVYTSQTCIDHIKPGDNVSEAYFNRIKHTMTRARHRLRKIRLKEIENSVNDQSVTII